MPSWIGWPEIVVVAIIALVVFGPKRLPDLGHSIGKSITGFRRGLKETGDELRAGLADDQGTPEPPKADDEARTDILSTAEREELLRLRRENSVLKAEVPKR